ncbi:MAG: FMN-binding protein [Chitinispirillia bacterium]
MENIKMIVSLTLICGLCGFLLAGVRTLTEDRIEIQILRNVQMPAVKSVLESSDNDLMQDRRKIRLGNREITVFLGKKNGKIWALAFESEGSGFGGKLGVILGVDVYKNVLTGIGITTCTETPGIGMRVKDMNFRKGFKGKSVTDAIRLKADNGVIDGISGATYSSRASCEAVSKGLELYKRIKAEVMK